MVREGDTVRIAVDDDTELELHVVDGTVSRADAIRCGCLLAPDCLHRAAAASAAPVGASVPPSVSASTPVSSTPSASATAAATATAAASASATASAQDGGPEGAGGPEPTQDETALPARLMAARAVFDAAAAVLDAGADGSGAVLQAELLRAAHTARLAGLPRAAASAVSVVNGVRAARSADPAHRLPELVEALRAVLGVAHRLPAARGPELAELRGTVRQPYIPDGSLRLYGLFSEPVLTATGYAGAVTWTADAEGRLYTVSDVAPGGPGRATGAADRAVRIGDTALTHRELSRAGLAVTGATVSRPVGGRGGRGAGGRAPAASPGAPSRSTGCGRRPSPSRSPGFSKAAMTCCSWTSPSRARSVRPRATVCWPTAPVGALRLTTAHQDPALVPRQPPPAGRRPGQSAADRGPARCGSAAARGLAGPGLTEHPADPAPGSIWALDRLQHADLPAPAARPRRQTCRQRRARPSRLSGAADEAPTFCVAGCTKGSPGAAVCWPSRAARPSTARVCAVSDWAPRPTSRRVARGRGGPCPRRVRPSAPADTDRFARAWLASAVYTAEAEQGPVRRGVGRGRHGGDDGSLNPVGRPGQLGQDLTSVATSWFYDRGTALTEEGDP